MISSGTYAAQIPLSNGQSWLIGRGADCNIRVPDRCVSRKHAAISVHHRAYSLHDLSSLNDTFVNGQRVHGSVALQHGDRIIIGKTELRFQHPSTVTSQVAIVLLLQPKARQAHIWWELLNSQGVIVLFQPTVKQEIQLSQVMDQWLSKMQQLPHLLLLDIHTTNDDPRQFCHWCRTVHPELGVVLTDAWQTEVSAAARQQVIAEGALGFLPGLPELRLLYHAPTIRQQVTVVLQALQWQPLREDNLITTLQLLEADQHNDIPPTASLHEYLQA